MNIPNFENGKFSKTKLNMNLSNKIKSHTGTYGSIPIVIYLPTHTHAELI